MRSLQPQAWLAALEQALLGECGVPPGERLLVAVSGGADSMVLLRGLASLAPAHGWKLTVAHLNHGLRGRASAADERLVRREAERLGLKCVVGQARLRQPRSGDSLEMEARAVRHEFLARTARAVKAPKIVLAHHADDQVELFLLRLLRGSGIGALGGMTPSSPSPADQSRTLLRPLLGFRKALLLDIAAQFRVPFREDASNQSLDILRNRVRRQLLPLLRQEYQPGIDATVLRTMEILREEASSLHQWNSSLSLPFADLPVALQRRRLHAQLLALGAEPDFDKIETLRKAPGQSVAFDAPEGATAPRLLVMDRNGMVTDALSSGAFQSTNLQLDVSRAGEGDFGDLRLTWELRPSDRFAPQSEPGQEQFDAELVGATVTLRHWRAGDRFQPLGMPRPVKVQDLFTNRKVPRATRRSLVVAATASGELFWIQGLRISEHYKITPRTIRRLIWRWQNR